MLRRLVNTNMVWIAPAAALTFSAIGQAQGMTAPFDGRWVVPPNAWFESSTASGQGRGGRGSQAPEQDIVLELRVTPAGAISGRATGVGGRRGAPGSHPAHDVEITRATLKGDTLTFQIWQFDGFHNRLRVTARRAAADLELEFQRDTPTGPDTFTTRARRAHY
jgi:hypothetical protein